MSHEPASTGYGRSWVALCTPVVVPRFVHFEAMSTHRANITEEQHIELPVEELLRRARPLPVHDEMVIEDLCAEEGEAFVLAVES